MSLLTKSKFLHSKLIYAFHQCHYQVNWWLPVPQQHYPVPYTFNFRGLKILILILIFGENNFKKDVVPSREIEISRQYMICHIACMYRSIHVTIHVALSAIFLWFCIFSYLMTICVLKCCNVRQNYLLTSDAQRFINGEQKCEKLRSDHLNI